MFRGMIPGPWQQDRVVTEVSEEAAASAERKLERLREQGDTVRLSGVEFTSYIRFRMAERFSTGDLELPNVAFAGETVKVNGRLPKDRIPERDLRRMGPVADFIADTANVSVDGRMRMLAPGRAALKVESVKFEIVDIPRDKFLPILSRVRGMDEPGLERDEVAFQLPPGVAAARVENGMLVLGPGPRR